MVMLFGGMWLALLASYALSPWLVRLCARVGMVGEITERSSHRKPTPHGGGLVFPLLATPLWVVLTWYWPLPFRGFLGVLALGGLLVAYVGWLDDRHELGAHVRLFAHLFVVAIALMLLPPMFDFMPLWAEKILLMLGWGWFVNLYNFMDGADGLATTQAIFMGVALAFIVPAFAPLGLLVAAVAWGFLRVNAPPAKVFLGDTGSTWLGFMLGGLYLLAATDDTFTVIWPLCTIPLVFCADATSTLLRRILQGHKPWQPHKTFWFHRYMALGRTHMQLVRAVAWLNATLLIFAVVSLHFGVPPAGFLAGIVAMLGAAWYIRMLEKRR